MRKLSPLCALLILIFALNVVTAAELPKLETKVKTIAVFKNGLGFVFRSGKTPLADGWADMAEMPSAALGTLWFGTMNPLQRVEEVVSYTSNSDGSEYRDASSIYELLDLNMGKRMTVTYLLGSGNSYMPSGSGEPRQATGRLLSAGGQMIVVETANDGAKVAIKKDSIQTIELGSDGVLKSKTKTTSTVNRVKLRVGGNPKESEISMSYLEKGLTWTPSYVIDIHDEKTAVVTLQALLVDDTEDLNDTDVSFVVGYPSFQFVDVVSPMSLQQSVATFLSALANGRSDMSSPSSAIMAQSFSNALSIASPRDINETSASGQRRPDLSYSAKSSMQGTANEDLLFYHQQHVNLKKGDRATYTIFSAKVPYEHLYELSVPDNWGVDGNGISTGSPSDESPQIWHVLRLTNNGEQGWTTAPAFVVNDSMPVAQQTLTYTPSNATNTLRLTVATDVRGLVQQTEVSRTPIVIDEQKFDKITVRGTTTLSNYKSGKVKLNVTKNLVGEVNSANAGAKIEKLAQRLTAVNPSSRISWEVELGAGAQKALTYQYTVLIRR